MAIKRPSEGSGRSKNPKQKTLGGVNKKAPTENGNHQKTVSVRTERKAAILTPPKSLKSESDWLNYLRGVSFARTLDFILKKPDRMTVTMALVLRQLANKILKATQAHPTEFNEWLEYFSTMTGAETQEFVDHHGATMDNEALAAAQRWLEIGKNPLLIDKIVTARMERRNSEEEGTLLAAANDNDLLASFKSLRNSIARKLDEGIGARDMSQMIKQYEMVVGNIAELERKGRAADDDATPIRKILMNSRKRAVRAKIVQATEKISDVESIIDEELE